MDRPGAFDSIFGANFFFNILLHVPCDFMGHIWLFSTVMGCVLQLIKMCPKYMVYFFRIRIEKISLIAKVDLFACLLRTEACGALESRLLSDSC